MFEVAPALPDPGNLYAFLMPNSAPPDPLPIRAISLKLADGVPWEIAGGLRNPPQPHSVTRATSFKASKFHESRTKIGLCAALRVASSPVDEADPASFMPASPSRGGAVPRPRHPFTGWQGAA